jgi:ubiquinone/menaquinone biosynthesis C-methylase UbiE
MKNHFITKSAAERYAKGRPYFHPVIIKRIKDFLSITEPLSSALDVGCGTGLSTIALKELAGNVIGVDNSAEMVALAEEVNEVRYIVTPDENLPFAENKFDIITLSQVFHWLDGAQRDRFLTEARRVLRPSGWLIAYNNCPTGQMAENADPPSWYEEYLKKYPMPPREKDVFTEKNANAYGFYLLEEEVYKHTIGFSLEGSIDFLITRSNIIEEAEEEIEDLRLWLRPRLKSEFGNAKEQRFKFTATISYLQRAT